jgi:hypothetical protein
VNGRPAFLRAGIGLVFAVAVGAGVVFGAFAAALAGGGQPSASPSGSLVAVGSSGPPGSSTPAPTLEVTPTPSATPEPTPEPTATPQPTPTPKPTPRLVAAPLTGLPVTEAVAKRHVIAVMVDDHWDARPQSGFNNASIVWQAPAEGGIPRYMMLFQDGLSPSVGPVRSARYYFVGWASEWDSLYVHVGGSPQALDFLHSSKGRGGALYDADEFRWGGSAGYLWRTRDRFAPHNVYSDGKHLRQLAKRVGAKDAPIKPAWTFAPDAAMADRPKGGTIVVPYLYNRIVYHYDRVSNRYLRSVTDETKQVDRGTGKRVAPKNVVILVMHFGPLNDGSPKHRLEADFIGTGRAWIATNGKTVRGTWKKTSLTSPTRLYGPDGKPVTLTAGQTFVQVVPTGTKLSIKDGKVPPPIPAPRPAGAGDMKSRGPDPL